MWGNGTRLCGGGFAVKHFSLPLGTMLKVGALKVGIFLLVLLLLQQRQQCSTTPRFTWKLKRHSSARWVSQCSAWSRSSPCPCTRKGILIPQRLLLLQEENISTSSSSGSCQAAGRKPLALTGTFFCFEFGGGSRMRSSIFCLFSCEPSARSLV